jgi:hypothetical protein
LFVRFFRCVVFDFSLVFFFFSFPKPQACHGCSPTAAAGRRCGCTPRWRARWWKVGGWVRHAGTVPCRTALAMAVLPPPPCSLCRVL